jgi:hypothetical protein
VRTLAEENGIGWNWWTHKKIATTSAPASAPFAPGYQAVVNYWRGEGPRPSAAAARDALFAMARGLDLDRTTLNEGVLASLFDDSFGMISRPYLEHRIPGSIHAVHYDFGNQGVAYGDQDPWTVSGSPGSGNAGGAYRNDGVDIEPSGDPQGFVYNVGWIEALEWLQYTVTVEKAGAYDVEFRVASAGAGGRFVASLDGENLGAVTVPGTGGWQNWQSVWLRGVQLPAGEHVLTLTVRTGGFNLNTMRFTESATTGFEDAPDTGSIDVRLFPNPAGARATLNLSTSEPAHVDTFTFDSLGRLVLSQADGLLPPGDHLIKLNTPVASGVYLVRVLVRATGGAGTYDRLITVRR